MVCALRDMILHLHAEGNECIGLENSIYCTINQSDPNRKKKQKPNVLDKLACKILTMCKKNK